MTETATTPKKRQAPKREFKGIWIPAELWTNTELTWMEKLMYAEIDSLCGEDGCYASNNYLAKFFQMSPPWVSAIINKLITKGFIRAEYERKGKEIQKRILFVVLKNAESTGDSVDQGEENGAAEVVEPSQDPDEGYSESRLGGSQDPDKGYSGSRIGVVRITGREININKSPSENTINMPASQVEKKPLPYLIDICDQINHIPRDKAVFAREMKAAKEIVAMTEDIHTHHGGDDIYTALDWIVALAQKLKAGGHWFLKTKPIKPTIIRYCYDDIITMIDDEKKRQEDAALKRAEHEALKQPAVVR